MIKRWGGDGLFQGKFLRASCKAYKDAQGKCQLKRDIIIIEDNEVIENQANTDVED